MRTITTRCRRRWWAAGRRVKGDQHLKYPEHTPLANLLLTMLDRAGVPLDRFGDSSGKFAEV